MSIVGKSVVAIRGHKALCELYFLLNFAVNIKLL